MTADLGLDTSSAGASDHSSGLRVLLVWCPQWSVVAVRRAQGIASDAQLALVDKGVVVASSAAALEEGVTPGLRVRQAQHRCPDMTVLPYDPALELAAFEPVMRAIEEKVPDIHLVRPGLAAVRAQGPSRFYGGDRAAAHTLLTHLQARVDHPVRVAVADGLFAAEQAAYTTTDDSPVAHVPRGESATFLAHLPVDTLDREVADGRMSNVLRRMGIRTLGDLAALPRADVHARFGASGLRAHRLAGGVDVPALAPRAVPQDLTVEATLDPGSDQVEHIVAVCQPQVDALMSRLTAAALLCHGLRIVTRTEAGRVHRRLWQHPWHFTANEVLDRVRWQLQDVAADDGSEDDSLHRAVVSVRIEPESVDAAAHHAPGLWGDRPDEHVVQTLTGLQHQLGHHGVLVSTVSGGRLLDERRVLRPWGDALPDRWERRLEQPWPGTVPGPAPATVFAQARPVQVLGADREAVSVDDRSEVRTPPAWFVPTGDAPRRVTAWAGPWPVRQRWWRAHRAFNRFQLVDGQEQAWLLLTDGRDWWAEARYD
ncbi:DNA polymerase Y family protein [Luteipulveratus sp. YIM 133132]|uniref:Y-family DNA polymerase n=1 Tax=Luteipulveratus flavus TaxID=3031728 RepID=UPI0023AF732F|nr:DNA polymerase Y family protein [Luteipulveratus sp. YIM 133132]MDE9367167.1 DNA polymerase Y family protein [Luteipulveratus sp. YIM 133132]